MIYDEEGPSHRRCTGEGGKVIKITKRSNSKFRTIIIVHIRVSDDVRKSLMGFDGSSRLCDEPLADYKQLLLLVTCQKLPEYTGMKHSND